jgi:uncharacterized membrane protein YidH (DUF202 family)
MATRGSFNQSKQEGMDPVETAVDREIQELDSLITLQQQKVSLLRQRRMLTSQSGAPSPHHTEGNVASGGSSSQPALGRSMLEQPAGAGPSKGSAFDYQAFPDKGGGQEKGAETSKQQEEKKEQEEEDADKVPPVLPAPPALSPRLKHRASMSSSGSLTMGLRQRSQSVKTFFQDVHRDDPAKQWETGMTRYAKLTSELANERNMLAWTRTALAGCRTTFAAMGLKYATGDHLGGILWGIMAVGFAALSLYIYMNGFDRYKKIKIALAAKNPPLHFDRLSNTPQSVAFIAILVVILYNVGTQYSHGGMHVKK